MALIMNRNVAWGPSLFGFHAAAGPGSRASVEPFASTLTETVGYVLYDTRGERAFDLAVDTAFNAALGGARTSAAGLALDLGADGAPSAGTVRSILHSATGPGFDVLVFGISAPAAGAFAAVAATPDAADDLAFADSLLRGDDLADLSDLGDRFGAKSGRDLVLANAGNDTVTGGAGDDGIVGGLGRDSLSGWAGDDILIGNEGNDGLYGNAGDDTLDGGVGNDALTGGTGRDAFAFRQADGRDVITDFMPGEDRIVIGAGAARFRQLAISQDGDDVRIAFAATVVILRDRDADDIGRASFAFDPDPVTPGIAALFFDTPFVV